MRTSALHLIALLCLLVPVRAGAESAADVAAPFAIDAPHVRVELLADQAALRPGHAAYLGLRFVLEKGWHVYWRNPGDSGEAPRVRWSLPDGAAAKVQIGELLWPLPHRHVTGPLGNYVYEDEVLLLAPLRVDPSLGAPGAAAVPITADVNWLVCSEPCIPGKARLTLTLPVQSGDAPPAGVAPAQATWFAAAERALPMVPPPEFRLSGQLTPTHFVLRADLGLTPPPALQFLPLIAGQIDNAAEAERTTEGTTAVLRLQRSEQLIEDKDIPMLRGLLVVDPEQPTAHSYAVEIPLAAGPAPGGPAAAAASTTPSPSSNLGAPAAPAVPFWLALAFALLGGALLNLMPCVFPVLSIKALGLVQMSASDRRAARGHALAYTAGILASFWALAGVLIALRYTGQQIGWGFHLQSPRFLVGLAALLFFLGLNLLGVFELGIGLTQLGQATVGHNGYAGAFATGVLATVVATPCTAPFMGTAVGFALSQPALWALLIFSFLGLGLALPYVLLLWIPGLLRILPRPGAWMETFKEIMGFLLFLTVLWLAWVLGAQAGANGVVALLGGLQVVGVAAWLLHRFADRRLVSGSAAVLLFAGAVLPGLLVPPQLAATAAPRAASSEELPWEPYSPAALAAHQRAGRPVLVDFTADWCVSCKVNERLVLRSSEVRQRIAALGVVAMKADWTREDPVITQALQSFGRSGVPLYVLYGRDPNARASVLPAVLSKGVVLRALDELAAAGPDGAASPTKGQNQP